MLTRMNVNSIGWVTICSTTISQPCVLATITNAIIIWRTVCHHHSYSIWLTVIGLYDDVAWVCYNTSSLVKKYKTRLRSGYNTSINAHVELMHNIHDWLIDMDPKMMMKSISSVNQLSPSAIHVYSNDGRNYFTTVRIVLFIHPLGIYYHGAGCLYVHLSVQIHLFQHDISKVLQLSVSIF